MTIQQQKMLAIAVLVVTSMAGAIQVAGPEALGISSVGARWLDILVVGLAVLQGFLPRVQGAPTDPESLADHVWELSDADRDKLTRTLEARSAHERAIVSERKP